MSGDSFFIFHVFAAVWSSTLGVLVPSICLQAVQAHCESRGLALFSLRLELTNQTPDVVRLSADQDSVRLLAVEGCGQFARLLTKDESVKDILPVVQKFSTVSAFSGVLSPVC